MLHDQNGKAIPPKRKSKQPAPGEPTSMPTSDNVYNPVNNGSFQNGAIPSGPSFSPQDGQNWQWNPMIAQTAQHPPVLPPYTGVSAQSTGGYQSGPMAGGGNPWIQMAIAQGAHPADQQMMEPPAGYRDKLKWMRDNNIVWDKEKGFSFAAPPQSSTPMAASANTKPKPSTVAESPSQGEQKKKKKKNRKQPNVFDVMS